MKERTAKTLLARRRRLLRFGGRREGAGATGQEHQGRARRRRDQAGGVTAVPVEDVSVLIDPRAEWRQILREAWRLNRDFFYAPNYHGVDWNAALKKYEPLLDHAATRGDVGRIVSAMASELRVGHSFSTEGESIDTAAERRRRVARCGLRGRRRSLSLQARFMAD